jgi:hypothetical protein
MQHATLNLSSGRSIISGGIRSFWRRGFLCHGNDQAIRFMQRVRWKLVLSVVLIGPDPAAFFLTSEILSGPGFLRYTPRFDFLLFCNKQSLAQGIFR